MTDNQTAAASPSPPTAPKPSWKQRLRRTALVAGGVLGLIVLVQTGILRISLPGAIDPNADPRIAELETALEEARSAAEEAAKEYRAESSRLQGELRTAEQELSRLRPIVAKYQTEYDQASASKLVSEIEEAHRSLETLAAGFAEQALRLAELNRTLGAASSAAADLDLAREFLEAWDAFQAEKELVDKSLAALGADLGQLKTVAGADPGSSGAARVQIEAAQAELSRARTATEHGRERLDALSQATTQLAARADSLRQAWLAAHPGEELTGPTAREFVSGFNESEAGQALAARQVIWQERLEDLLKGSDLVRLSEGMTAEKLVRKSSFAAYIAAFEQSYTDSEARRRYLSHMVDGKWWTSPADVVYLQEPGYKREGPKWIENPIGFQSVGFTERDWEYVMKNSRVCKFPDDADFEAERAWFNQYFVAMVVADVGPSGQPALLRFH